MSTVAKNPRRPDTYAEYIDPRELARALRIPLAQARMEEEVIARWSAESDDVVTPKLWARLRALRGRLARANVIDYERRRGKR